MSNQPARIAALSAIEGAPSAPPCQALALAPVEHAPEPEPEPERWTPERQARFLRELAACHCVSTAARSVGMSRQSAYRLRARLRGQPFDRGWAMALGCALDALAQAALERALNGVEVQHFHHGELVGTSRRFDDRLTIALLDRAAVIGRLPAVPHHSTTPRDFEEQIERVEHGPETWEDESVRRRRR
jgi:hypothetical protein